MKNQIGTNKISILIFLKFIIAVLPELNNPNKFQVDLLSITPTGSNLVPTFCKLFSWVCVLAMVGFPSA
jgi:hypothetical protein